jgi:hypothetical protein
VANRADEARDLFGCEFATGKLRVNSGSEERFIGVNVADSSDQALVKDEGLDWSRSTAKDCLQIRRCESGFEWLRSEFCLEWSPGFRRPPFDAAKLTLIGEAK